MNEEQQQQQLDERTRRLADEFTAARVTFGGEAHAVMYFARRGVRIALFALGVGAVFADPVKNVAFVAVVAAGAVLAVKLAATVFSHAVSRACMRSISRAYARCVDEPTCVGTETARHVLAFAAREHAETSRVLVRRIARCPETWLPMPDDRRGRLYHDIAMQLSRDIESARPGAVSAALEDRHGGGGGAS